MRLYLTRHAQSDWNAEFRYISTTDRDLSDEGRVQAHALGSRLAREPLEAVFSSPRTRALDTARAVAEPHGLDVEVIDGLSEIDFGDWEGLTYDEIRDAFPAFDDWLAAPEATPIPGGETWHGFLTRVVSCTDELLARPYAAAAVVSHAGWLKMTLSIAMGLRRTVFGNLRLDHCGLTVVEAEADGWQGNTRLYTFNETCHLDRQPG